VLAANGIDVIGVGNPSVMMGGADVAAVRDVTAAFLNPAGLTGIAHREVYVDANLDFALDVGHADQFGNDQQVDNSPIKFFDIAYGQRINDAPLVWGAGLMLQGGAGQQYHNVNTPFATKDELSTALGIVKLTPGVAWRPNQKLNVGVSLGVYYSTLEQKIFPNTSTSSFSGSELRELSALDLGAKLGAQYELDNGVMLGASYQNKVPLSPHGGRLTLDMSGNGLGKVTYRDVKVDGVAQPREIEVGVAYRHADRWLYAADVKWINWADAMRASTVTARDPDSAFAPVSLAVTSTMNWHNQWVWAAGASYQLSDRWLLRGGYNYGKSPVPEETVNPLLTGFAEHTLTFGSRYSWRPTWSLEDGLEWQIRKRVTYNNPEWPLGPGASETLEQLVLRVAIAHQW
jgi:long-chain fatty acid transport protein